MATIWECFFSRSEFGINTFATSAGRTFFFLHFQFKLRANFAKREENAKISLLEDGLFLANSGLNAGKTSFKICKTKIKCIAQKRTVVYVIPCKVARNLGFLESVNLIRECNQAVCIKFSLAKIMPHQHRKPIFGSEIKTFGTPCVVMLVKLQAAAARLGYPGRLKVFPECKFNFT